MTLVLVSALLVTALSVAIPQSPAKPADAPTKDAATLPDTPQGACAKAWFKVIRDGSADELRAFETAYRAPKRLAETPLDQRVARLPSLRKEFGTVTLDLVDSANASRIITRATSSTRGPMEITFEFDAAGKLDGIAIASGDAAENRPVDSARRDALIEAACNAVRSEYVYPDKGEAMASAIITASKHGEYASITTERDLVEKLTKDMRAITNDRHLRVRVAPTEEGKPEPRHGPNADEARRDNWGFRSCSIEPGNVGVLRFDGFIPTEEAMKVADAALAFLSRCDAIVFDIRFNGGGSPEMLNHIAGYFFDKPTLLNRMKDRDGNVIGEGFSDETVPGQRFDGDLPVFIVTSARTFSCAEEFAYDLQCLKRATLVGETTGGGAHPVKPVRLDERIAVIMPHIRACNPVTNTNWEGVGVKPEVEVAADQALEKAIQLASEKAAERRAAKGSSR